MEQSPCSQALHCFSAHPTFFILLMVDQIRSLWPWVHSECLLVLAVMAYGSGQAAILCAYSVVMNGLVCGLAGYTGHLLCLLPCSSYPQASLPMDGMSSTILSVRFSPLLKLACSDTSLNELLILTTGIFTLLLPFGFVLLSYVRIATAVLRIRSAHGRLKAFSTCASHLTVVVIFYGAAISMYMKPQSKSSWSRQIYLSVLWGSDTHAEPPNI